MKSITEIQLYDIQNENLNGRNTTDSNMPEYQYENSYDHLLNEINDNIDPLKFCLLFIDIKTGIGKINYYFPIITHLLNIVKKIKLLDRENLKCLFNFTLKQAIVKNEMFYCCTIMTLAQITLVFIKSLQEKRIYNEEEVQTQISNQLYGNVLQNDLYEQNEAELKFVSRPSVFQEVSNGDDAFYDGKGENIGKYAICEESSLKYILNMNNKNLEIIKSLTESILEYQKYYIYILLKYFKITRILSRR